MSSCPTCSRRRVDSTERERDNQAVSGAMSTARCPCNTLGFWVDRRTSNRHHPPCHLDPTWVQPRCRLNPQGASALLRWARVQGPTQTTVNKQQHRWTPSNVRWHLCWKCCACCAGLFNVDKHKQTLGSCFCGGPVDVSVPLRSVTGVDTSLLRVKAESFFRSTLGDFAESLQRTSGSHTNERGQASYYPARRGSFLRSAEGDLACSLSRGDGGNSLA
jgi:hypothetical protein